MTAQESACPELAEGMCALLASENDRAIVVAYIAILPHLKSFFANQATIIAIIRSY